MTPVRHTSMPAEQMDWSNKSILLTGGTGSFGQKFVEVMLRKHRPRSIRIYSRDEWKQVEMRRKFPEASLRFLIGDVRDRDRLNRAMTDADIVVHAAALKHVPVCEYNPIEAIHTNVLGAQNVINAAVDRNIEKVVAVSTDKAANPINLYGASKLCAEKLFIAANAYAGKGRTRFSVVRYGNVVGSRGSVVPLFQRQREQGKITITDERMTRFWITLEQGVELVVQAITKMHGGELFIPKIPTMSVVDLADVVAPGCKREVIGIRPGEKLHEVLLAEDESPRTLEYERFYVVEPPAPTWRRKSLEGGKAVPPDFRYSSDTYPMRLSVDQLKKMLATLEPGK